MHHILVVAIVVLVAIFSGLTLLIAGNKAWRDARLRAERVRRRQLTPSINAYVRGTESILDELDEGLSPRDRLVVEAIALERLQDAEGLERQRLGSALEDLGFVGAYLAQLESSSWWRRANAAERLGLAVASRAIDPLTAKLDDPSPEVRMRVAKALARIGGIAAMRPLIRALDEPNRWSTVRMAGILSSMGREVGDELTASFDKLTPRGRAAAIDVLAGIRHLNVAPWLRERLRDADADVRSRAAHALGVVGDHDAGEPLALALGDPAWPVRAMAAKSLGVLLHVDAVPALCDALRDDEWWVRVNAAEALRLMGPVGLIALGDMLDDADIYARHQAVFMLEEAGIVDDHVELLIDGDSTERAEAARFVLRVLRTGQDGRVRELAERHEDPNVQAKLAALLAEIDRPLEAVS